MAAGIFVAIIYQLATLHGSGALKPGNFFSFFTIQSNIIGFVALAWAALATKQTKRLVMFRGGATLYLAITGIVYGTLLAHLPGAATDTSGVWVNNIVHRIAPVVIVVDWFLNPPMIALAFRQALVWLAYPILWLVYTLIRGNAIDWWPYPFLNPHKPGGWGRVTLYCIGISIVFIGATWLLTWLTNISSKRVRA